ncbi:dienelactone hydrolase [Rhodococcus sp. OK611]|uniref:alpha/beta hydrolase n=1 Tax=unclassified Rhodococcus (in: high G+C Gram-positive bacteria) TaxID=192944 RepID=UPI000BCE020D|nr:MULTISPECIES: alpha/beta hydrolase [unclassified Rhodococcus (in: high G+C Gram-positive bacteria)]PTR43322.1 dienelactone hydrolase [Rhodococcus sp. OK611]SNX91185.1 Dienelactone hydrolase [Rhodococcus sp. OK270]
MHFTAETSSNGVVERNFTLGDITGLLWSPASGSEPAPLVLMAHGGGQHKSSPGILARAHRFVRACGFHVAALDAPGHGERPRTAADEQHIAVLRQAQAAGEPLGPVVVEIHKDLAARAVPEWRATLDALLALPEIGADVPVGFWGIMQGTGIGVPLTAAEPRIAAAVFGCLGHESLTEAAAQITVPIEFLLQWDDEHVERQSGLALFDAFASKEKSLHANAGGHVDMPRFEMDSATRFFARHLGQVGASPA